MSKNEFLSKAAIPIFLCGLLLCSLAYIPILRFSFGIDETISIAFSNTVVLMVGGYMAGVGAMIFLCRSAISHFKSSSTATSVFSNQPHWLGLSFYIPIPFLNFVIIYWLWRKQQLLGNERMELEFRKSLNFQMTIYLFLLLSIFLVPILIGFLMIFLSLILHLFSTLYMGFFNTLDKPKNHPITINIIALKSDS